MEIKKNKLKQIGRKYLAPAIILATSIFGGNAYAKLNPYQELAESQRNVQQTQKIEQEKYYRIELEDKIRDFERYKANLKGYVVQRILDGELSIKEGDEIRKYIDCLINKRKNLYSLIGEGSMILPENQKKSLVLDEGLRRGLDNSYHYGGRSLEKYFASKGLEVNVQGRYEALKIGFGLALTLLFPLAIISILTSKKHKEEKEPEFKECWNL